MKPEAFVSFLARERAATTLDELQTLVALVGTVDIDVEVANLIERMHLEALSHEQFGRGPGTGNKTVNAIAHLGEHLYKAVHCRTRPNAERDAGFYELQCRPRSCLFLLGCVHRCVL